MKHKIIAAASVLYAWFAYGTSWMIASGNGSAFYVAGIAVIIGLLLFGYALSNIISSSSNKTLFIINLLSSLVAIYFFGMAGIAILLQ